MKATIKSIHLEQFKGVKDKTFDLANVPRVISGRNASGKSTIADAYYWLFFDKDTRLVSNPDIKPLGVEECQPTVTVIMDIDGKEISFSKIQKIKASKPDENGVIKRSSTNTYSCNSIPLSERDFKSKLQELGFDFGDSFLIMSHTDVFSNMKNADMRKALFEMVTEHSDKYLADKMGTVPELSALLENYKLEEVDAMHKSTIKKCKEQLENIPGQIEGLEMAKTEDIDTSEQELLIKSLNEQIATEQANVDQIREEKDRYATLCQTGLQLEFDRNTELTHMNELAMAGRREIEDKLNESHNNLIDIKRKINSYSTDVTQTQQCIDRSNKTFGELKQSYVDAKAVLFDDKSTVCPVCNRPYESDRVEEIKAKFEADKQAKMDAINHTAKEVQNEIKKFTSDLDDYKKLVDEAKKELEQAEELNASLQKQLDEFKPSEVTKTEKLVEIESKIAENDKAKAEIKAHNNDSRLAEINSKISELQAQINEANKAIGQSSNNVRIDEQIESLQEKQIELEQARANAEKILFQCELLAKEKNNVVAKEINSNFDYVEFQLWEMQKNGVLKDSCIPKYKDKVLGVATNTALETLMKIDICEGFQKFYGAELPIFVDKAEVFSSDTYNRLECKSQHIYLKVSDSDLEIK